MSILSPTSLLTNLCLGLSLLNFTSCGKIEDSKELSSVELLATTQNGTPLVGKWASFPLSLNISDSFENEVEALRGEDEDGNEIVVNELESVLIQDMSALWDQARGDDQTMIEFTSNGENLDKPNLDDYLNDGEMGIYRKTDNWFSTISSQSLAVTHYSGFVDSVGVRVLQHADIIVNDYNFDFSSNPNGEAGKYDLPTVILHELGHLLGIDHLSGKSIMNSNLSPASGDRKRVVEFKDSQALRDIYGLPGFEQGSTGSAAMMAHMGVGVVEPLGPGTPFVGTSELRANGDCVHFENGKKVFTH